jgi:glycosyltransferase involved in cell wall biosynthesis
MTYIPEKIKKCASEADAKERLAYGIFSKVIERKDLKIGVEIGVAFGGHAESILKTSTIDKLYGVDPYLHIESYDDPLNLSQEEFNQLYDFTIERLASFGNRYQHIRKMPKDAAENVPEIDFIYINTDYSYNRVWEDLCKWFPKVKNGGILGGHKYNHSSFPGVTKAVDEFFRRFNGGVHYDGNHVWWVEKKPLNISFIIPAFMCANTIKESVNSIFETNFEKNDEVVIVYDLSSPSDNLENTLFELKNKYPQINLIKHLIPRGGGVARNIAVENCINQLIFCLDSDNILAPFTIQRLKIFLINSGADVAAFQELHYFKDSIEQITHKWQFKSGLISLADCLSGGVTPGASGNYLYTKNSWIRAGGYPEFTFLDTWGFGFRQLATKSKMMVMEDSYYFHRYGHNSYWVREYKKGTTSLQALQIILPYLYLIKDIDIEYLLSSKGRDSWFSQLNNRPIKLKNNTSGKSGFVIYKRCNRVQIIINMIKKIYKKMCFSN